MTFLHVSHPLRKMSPELLILLVITLLLSLAVLVINLIHQLPQERTVPAPIIASPNIPLHFSKIQGNNSITETTIRPLPVTIHQNVLNNALEQLLAGPTPTEKAAGYYSEIPQGTKLLGVTVTPNVIRINLSQQFTQGGGSTSMLQRVNELKSTVLAVEGPHTIQIAIEGKPLAVLGGEGLELN